MGEERRKVGGWWIKAQALEEGEEVKWSMLANHVQNGVRAVGGKLFLTDKRMIFSVNIIENVLKGKNRFIERVEITGVDCKPSEARTQNLFNGGLRKRLQVMLNDGTEELFVINRLETSISDLRRELRETGDSHL